MKLLTTTLLLYVMLCTRLLAGVPCTPLPFQLQNGQVADATQVMANYNFIISCLANAAAAGNNFDITSLSGLTTPISPALGGTSAFISSSASTGTANAQVVSATLPTYVQTVLTKVIFVAGFTNTAAMTLKVGTTSMLNVFRRTTAGIEALAGGEVIAGAVTEVTYDGTQYQLVNNVSPFPVGTVLDTVAAAADAGFLLMQGQCIASATFPALFAKMGSPGVGSCGAGQWPLPDGRGRGAAMLDSGGSNRLNINCTTSTALYTGCGIQNTTLLAAMIPTLR